MSKDFPWCEVWRALDELMSHVFMYICVFECCFRPERSFVIVYVCTLVQNLLVCCLWWKREIKIRLKSRGHCYYFKSSQSRNIGRESGCNNNHSTLIEINSEMHKCFGQIISNCGIRLKIRAQRSRPGPEQTWVSLKWNCHSQRLVSTYYK